MKAVKKLRSRRGLTLAETLVTVAVFAILSVAIFAGVNAAAAVYRESVLVSESQTLVSTLTQAIGDELRLGENVRVSGETVTFDSAKFGPGVSFQVTDGAVYLVSGEKTYDLIGKKTYTSGLKVDALTLSYDSGLYTLTLTVSAPGMPARETVLTIRALNS